MKSWRDAARAFIERATREGQEMGLRGPDLEKHVRAEYPFGERAMHPYKVWLSEMRKTFPRKRPSPPIDLTDHPFLRTPGDSCE